MTALCKYLFQCLFCLKNIFVCLFVCLCLTEGLDPRVIQRGAAAAVVQHVVVAGAYRHGFRERRLAGDVVGEVLRQLCLGTQRPLLRSKQTVRDGQTPQHRTWGSGGQVERGLGWGLGRGV